MLRLSITHQTMTLSPRLTTTLCNTNTNNSKLQTQNSTRLPEPHYAIPALPICRICPVVASSPRRTGHDAPFAFTNVTSSFVPKILNDDLAVSIVPYRGTSAVYLFGVESVVAKSRTSCFSWNSTLAVSLLIFFRKKAAMTFVAVW